MRRGLKGPEAGRKVGRKGGLGEERPRGEGSRGGDGRRTAKACLLGCSMGAEEWGMRQTVAKAPSRPVRIGGGD